MYNEDVLACAIALQARKDFIEYDHRGQIYKSARNYGLWLEKQLGIDIMTDWEKARKAYTKKRKIGKTIYE